MKRVVRSLLLFFCTTLFMLSASVCVCVVRVHADDTSTYYPYTAFECIDFYPNVESTFSLDKDGRLIVLKGTSGGSVREQMYAVSTENFKYKVNYGSSSCSVPTNNSTSNSGYYVIKIAQSSK